MYPDARERVRGQWLDFRECDKFMKLDILRPPVPTLGLMAHQCQWKERRDGPIMGHVGGSERTGGALVVGERTCSGRAPGTPIILSRMGKNFFALSAFVKKSAIFSSVGT